jgi:hypothetical protein
MLCLRCGYQNAPGAATCGQCGLALTTAGPPSYRPQPPGPHGQPGSPGASGPVQPDPAQPDPAQPGSGQPGQGQPGQGQPGSGQPGQGPWGPPAPPSGGPGQWGPPPYDGPAPYPAQGYGSPVPGTSAPAAPYPAGGPGDAVSPTQQWNRPPGYDPSYAPPLYSAPPGYAQPPAAYAAGTRAPTSAANRAGALTVLALAVVAGFGYAAWALFDRRGIFEAFADGTSTMTLEEARSSDRWDTILLVVAIVLVSAALLWWLVLRINAGTAGGSLETGGFAIVGLGIVLTAIGLVMSADVSSSGTRQDEGDKAASAALVYGLGFTVIALGLIIGIAAVRSTTRVGSFPHTGRTAGRSSRADGW